MPDLTRIACTRCKQSVYNCFVDGPDGVPLRVPLVIRMNIGQPEDTGPRVDVLAENVRVPSVVRELTLSPLGRIEFCVKCFGEVFGLPMVTADEDPMYSEAVFDLYQRWARSTWHDDSIPKVDRHALVNGRAIHALAVGWDEADHEDLPAEQRPPDPKPKAKRKEKG